MKNKSLKFVVDSRFFRGFCFTCMSDGIHNDFGQGETLEELKVQENNPHLIAVSVNRIRKMEQIYERSLSAPFCEITKDEYYDRMDILPPVRLKSHSFFMGEPYFGSLYLLCFTIGGRYFKGLRSIRTPHDELVRQMDSHYKTINYRATVLKEPTGTIADGKGGKTAVTAYSFIDSMGKKRFIGNLTTTENPDETSRSRQAMARTLLNLRKHHYQYLSAFIPSEDMVEFLNRVMERKQTILTGGTLMQYPTNRESVTVSGSIKETGEAFLFRIYDRDLFLYLTACLRSIKKEYIHQSDISISESL